MQYFDDMFWGRGCNKNWYSGNAGGLGQAWGGPTMDWVHPHFTAPAPALLGFDRNIDWHCHNHNDAMHAIKCVEANVNILSLYGNEIPYNVCRNAEWQLCAAKGALPGQIDGTIMFAFPPKDLKIEGHGGDFPLGECGSYAPMGCPGNGYASQDIFYLEVCLYDQVCSNRVDLWELEAGDPWKCELDYDGFVELRTWLLGGGGLN